ncbi:helix-turn-helix transcriptional regulator [Sulfitobacter mediterraneus]|uniref:helix-turn-helix transcriptional regulator n=1 Tax=Sulfitobacter mediterraneus TaxID=83219 RepID=UPI0021A4FE62|nr:YafY family protein [Sulfitobacter mediterraneus]UWR12563.1 YafY family transcriptional regulator [Sulfitobacter mediterraneus]
MSKSTRFFEVIQLLRSATKPILAREIAAALEVSVRTVYRDIASLQAMQTPILGEPGVGYVMRKGYDLPPINLDVDEAEAIAVGLSLIARTGDAGLWRAAGRAARKLQEAAPGTRKLVTSSWGVGNTASVDISQIRLAIRRECKLNIRYRDAEGRETARIVWPLVMIYYVDNAMIVAWCEKRQDLRHFRLDRMAHCAFLSEDFKGQGAALIAQWEQTQKHDTVSTKDL